MEKKTGTNKLENKINKDNNFTLLNGWLNIITSNILSCKSKKKVQNFLNKRSYFMIKFKFKKSKITKKNKIKNKTVRIFKIQQRKVTKQRPNIC